MHTHQNKQESER